MLIVDMLVMNVDKDSSDDDGDVGGKGFNGIYFHPHRPIRPTKPTQNQTDLTISPLYDILQYSNHIFSGNLMAFTIH